MLTNFLQHGQWLRELKIDFLYRKKNNFKYLKVEYIIF